MTTNLIGLVNNTLMLEDTIKKLIEGEKEDVGEEKEKVEEEEEDKLALRKLI